jgi:hypothetical protein
MTNDQPNKDLNVFEPFMPSQKRLIDNDSPIPRTSSNMTNMRSLSLIALLLVQEKVMGQCPLCIGGVVPPDLSLIIYEDQGLNFTCSDALSAAGTPSTGPDAPTCEDWLFTGAFCGCPLIDVACDLCYDGTVPPNLSLMPFPEQGNFTCGDALLFAGTPSTDPDAPTCEDWLFTGTFCGCPVPPDVCSLCDDGTPPPNLSLVPFPEDSNSTCGDFLAVAGVPSSDPDAPTCSDWLVTGVFCGCKPPPDPDCSLCSDDTQPPDLTLSPAYFDGLTCEDYVNFAAIIEVDAGDSTCKDVYPFGLWCGCTAPEVKCNLCEDESDLLNPNLAIAPDETCLSLSYYATFEEGDKCTAYQATFGVYCGCTNPIASVGYCRICGGDTILPDPGTVAYMDEDGFDVSCGEAELNGELETCDVVQSKYAEACCEATSTSPNPTPSPSAEAAPTTTAPIRSPIPSGAATMGSPRTLIAFTTAILVSSVTFFM